MANDTLLDKKITQNQVDSLQAPMELDLTAAFSVMRDDFIQMADDFEGTPEQYIEAVVNTLLPVSGEEVYKDDKGDKDMAKCKIEKACTPRGGEKRSDFTGRCIKEQMGKGKTQDQAVGMCMGIWNEAKKSTETKNQLFKTLTGIINKIRERL